MTKNKCLSVSMLAGMAALGLTACTPADQEYCSQYGVGGTAEYGKCLSYYQQQSAIFSADRGACELQADGTYPRSLYDTGHYQHVMGGYGPYGRYYGGQTVMVQPDYYHNAQVDQLRMRIVEPCMQARGWNSGSSWKAGRHAVKAAPRAAKSTAKLPWQQ